jgi:hypothetical protein
MKEQMEKIKEYIVGMMQQAAALTISQMTIKIVAGGNNGPMFIVNWQDYLTGQPRQATQQWINDYITNSFAQGRGSASGYASAFEGIGNNAFNMGVGQYMSYTGRLTEQLKSYAQNQNQPSKIFEGNLNQIAAKGNMKSIDSLYKNSAAKAETNLASAAMAREEDAKAEARTKAAAQQGVSGKEDKQGNTITPAATIKDMLSNAQDIGNKIIANADSIPKILTSMVTKMASQLMTQGIGNIQIKLQKEVTGVRNRAQTQINAQIRTNGPGALFKR